MEQKISTRQLSFVKKWWISSRPFSFPASTMSVVFGTAVAVFYSGSGFNLWYFILAFFGMAILHAASNILSDVFDYRKGLDREPAPVSGGVVRGIITQKEALTGSTILFVTGTGIGLVLVYFTGLPLLYIGVTGLIIGIFYTSNNNFNLKYHALGDLAVFLNFGILGSLGAFYIQTGYLSWIPVIWAIPISLLVIGILHANNWRDIVTDQAGKISTVASVLGDKGSQIYYGGLLFLPYILITGYILVPGYIFPGLPAMPYSFFLVFLGLPLAVQLYKKAMNRRKPVQPFDFIALDGATAQFNLIFGLLCTLALVVYGIL